jgi:hypothetical protein
MENKEYQVLGFVCWLLVSGLQHLGNIFHILSWQQQLDKY